MKNASIRFKLIMSTLPSLIVLIACIVLFSVSINNTLRQSKTVYYEKLYGINSALVNADRDFYQAVQAATSLYNMTEFAPQGLTPELRGQFIDDYKDNLDQVDERVGKAAELAKTDDSLWSRKDDNGNTFQEDYEAFTKEVEEWKKSFDPNNPSMSVADFSNYIQKFNDTREYINSMTEITEAWAEEENSALASSVMKTLLIMIGVFAVIAIVCVIWVVYVIRLINTSVKLVSERLVKLSHYDLSDDPIKVDSKDELGVMKKALNDTEEALEQIVGTLKSTSNGLSNASDVVSQGTDATGVGIDNVSSAADELANASTSMAQDVSDISLNMTELSSIMERSVDSAQALSDASNKIESVTETGTEVVDELAGINERSFVEFNAIFDAIEDIKKSGAKISEASELILNIADQTNLLSLNASIEAARAGEAGKGFAVVADEIRNLSDESKENVDTINEILSELTAATNNAAEKADVVKEFVQKQNDAVGQTKESFDAIVTTVEGVEQAIADLEQINKELDGKSREIGESVSNLSALSQENAATSEQLSATAQTVQTNVEDLKATQGDVENSSGDLSDIVGKFILAQGDAVEVEQPMQEQVETEEVN